METPIQVHDLSILYRDKKAVQGLSFQVRRGEIFGFLGPNGAGKSSTLKCLLGLVRPSSGSVLLHGYPASDPRARVSIGYMPEEATYPRYLTPMEILIHYAALFGIDRRRAKVRADEMLELTGLTSFSGKRLSTLSKGTVQKVSLAQALIQRGIATNGISFRLNRALTFEDLTPRTSIFHLVACGQRCHRCDSAREDTALRDPG